MIFNIISYISYIYYAVNQYTLIYHISRQHPMVRVRGASQLRSDLVLAFQPIHLIVFGIFHLNMSEIMGERVDYTFLGDVFKTGVWGRGWGDGLGEHRYRVR